MDAGSKIRRGGSALDDPDRMGDEDDLDAEYYQDEVRRGRQRVGLAPVVTLT